MLATPLRMPIQLGKPFDYKEFDASGYDEPTDAEIEGIEAVYQITGFDNFSSYEIVKVLLDRSQYRGQKDLTVWIAAESQRRVQDDPNSSSLYEVQITFYDLEIEQLELWDFNHQNVIWYVLVKRHEDGKLAVLLTSTFGCGFKLVCNRANVVSMQPTENRPIQRAG
jgi:hypothetical protein